MLTHWPADDTVEWLSPIDFLLALTITRAIPSPRVLEVGVWKGGWSHTLARNTDAEVVGIDPYPGFDEVRSRMLHSAEDLGDRFTLHPSWAGVMGKFDLIHVDGEHTEAAASSDLLEAEIALADGGVIIMDDIAHPYFPGIASATYRFLADRGFAIFLYTRNKAYLCRIADHPRWYETMRVADTPLILERHIAPEPPEYLEVPDVGGMPMLLCVALENAEIAQGVVLQAATLEPVVGVAPPSRLRRLARDWLPPKVQRALVAGRRR